MEKVRFATNLATKRESGVMRITTNAIFQSISSINTRVPAMVISPVKSCVNPMRSPSANWSTSAMMRLTVSPVGCRSK